MKSIESESAKTVRVVKDKLSTSYNKSKPHIQKGLGDISKKIQNRDFKSEDFLKPKLFFGIWAVIGIIVLLATQSITPLYGVAIAAALSFLLTQYMLNQEWEGTITKIKEEKVHKGGSSEEDYDNYEWVTYAHIKLDNGKTKKVRPMHDWKVGDRIKKEKGKLVYEKIH